MYDELIGELYLVASQTKSNSRRELLERAADAIEELRKPKWIKIENRPMDDEERKYYSEHSRL